jgi:GNAT superfamily N-acetyltransferase
VTRPSNVSPARAAEDLHAKAGLTPPSGGPAPLHRIAARVRLAGDIEREIGNVRAFFRDRGHPAFTWVLGPNATPRDLEDRLRATGARDDASDPTLTAMVLDRPPPAAAGIDVRLVESLDDYLATADVIAGALTGTFTADELEAMRGQQADRYAAYRAHGTTRRYLALIDDAPVAYASLVPTTVGAFGLLGGATLPAARGRGAYRALVRARWDEAVRAGTPVLVTQATGMSRPILERLGFQPVARLVVLLDTTA